MQTSFEKIYQTFMKQSVLFFFKYYLFWIGFFLFFKVFFLLYNFSILSGFPSSDIIGIFTHGIIMDISAAGYLSLLPGLLIAFGFVLFPRLSRSIIKIYTLVLLIIVTIIGLGDAGLYIDWGIRINTQILLHLQNPGGMYAAISLGQIILILVCWIVICVGWYWLYKKIFTKKYKQTIQAKWMSIPLLVFLTAALILPIRGGVNTSPLNHSHVYFSNNLHANQSTYNYFWNFIYSISQAQFNKKLVNYMSADEATKIVASTYDSNETYPIYIKQKGQQPNVVFIILESFSSKIISSTGGLPNATPRLNQLCKEGILFTNFFATGNRSDKGICALIGGYPSVINGTTILSAPEKMKRLYYFPKQFKKHGYDLSFYYGGDINLYNTRSALMQSGFTHIVSNTDFPNNISSIQKWGVPDHHLYARFFDDLKNRKQPFFTTVYNISSHEPFDIPDYKKITGTESRDKYLNAIAYSDSCLGVFMDKLKASPLWKNTLVVITSDHGHLLPEPSTIEDPASYRVPLLWTGGVIDSSFVCDNIAMHNDLGPTLIQQMGWKDTIPKFSKNIFGKHQYAFYFGGVGWGFVSPDFVMFQNINVQQTQIFSQEMNQKSDSLINFARAFVQFLHDDFSK